MENYTSRNKKLINENTQINQLEQANSKRIKYWTEVQETGKVIYMLSTSKENSPKTYLDDHEIGNRLICLCLQLDQATLSVQTLTELIHQDQNTQITPKEERKRIKMVHLECCYQANAPNQWITPTDNPNMWTLNNRYNTCDNNSWKEFIRDTHMITQSQTTQLQQWNANVPSSQ